MSKIYGVDISEHNDNFDPTGQGFVIIRVGWGHFALDKQFTNNVKKCIAKNIPFGVYHYSYALNTEQAKSEALSVLKAIEPYKNYIKCGVWFDMEDADGYKSRHGCKINHANIAPLCWTFCKIIEDAGYYTGIYCSESWLQFLKPECNRFDKWVASWGRYNDGKENTDTSRYGTMHQFTSVPLDRDVMYKGFIYENKKRKGVTQAKQTPTPKKVVPSAKGFHKGDRVKVINARTYDGKAFKVWYPTYTVLEVKNDRVVIGVNGTVTAAVKDTSIKKV